MQAIPLVALGIVRRNSGASNDVYATSVTIELNDAVDQSEERVVFALAHPATGMEAVAYLTNENAARRYGFAAEPLDATPLSVGITSVAA